MTMDEAPEYECYGTEWWRWFPLVAACVLGCVTVLIQHGFIIAKMTTQIRSWHSSLRDLYSGQESSSTWRASVPHDVQCPLPALQQKTLPLGAYYHHQKGSWTPVILILQVLVLTSFLYFTTTVFQIMFGLLAIFLFYSYVLNHCRPHSFPFHFLTI